MAKTRCDIIVPVYNAPGDLRECVESVLDGTDGEFTLVVIDDASTDPGVGEYLGELESGGDARVAVKRNERNLGFVGTVNRGMRESGSDVVLLNSDTVVPRGWLGRLMDCAYSAPEIASVTPLTNNGTICSVPNFCEDNPLPDGFDAHRMDALVSAASMRAYPRIPTAVGFCMFIKRGALDEVGYFDDTTFGRGYAEENDWCCRAGELGFAHALDDATFVHHKGAMSFLGEKARMIEDNLKLLIGKYPYYFEMVDGFIARNPLWDVQENIKFRIGVDSKGGIRLLVGLAPGQALDGRPGEIFGGALPDGLSVYGFWVEDGDTLVLAEPGTAAGKPVTRRFRLAHPVGFPSYSHRGYRDVFEKIAGTYRIDALVMAGLMGHSLEVFGAARAMGLPVAAVAGPELFAPGAPAGIETSDAAKFREAWGRELFAEKLAGDPGALMEKWYRTLSGALDGADALLDNGGGAKLAAALMPGFRADAIKTRAVLPLAGDGLHSFMTELAGRGKRAERRVFSWPELSESVRDASPGTQAARGYTEKQRQAFDYMLSLANRNPGPLRLAKFLYRLLRGGAGR